MPLLAGKQEKKDSQSCLRFRSPRRPCSNLIVSPNLAYPRDLAVMDLRRMSNWNALSVEAALQQLNAFDGDDPQKMTRRPNTVSESIRPWRETASARQRAKSRSCLQHAGPTLAPAAAQLNAMNRLRRRERTRAKCQASVEMVGRRREAAPRTTSHSPPPRAVSHQCVPGIVNRSSQAGLMPACLPACLYL